MLLLLVFGLSWLGIRSILSGYVGTDGVFYDQTAINLSAGRGYTRWVDGYYRPMYGHTPGYSFWLSLLYQLVDVTEELSDQAGRVVFATWVQSTLLCAASFIFFWLWSRSLKKPILLFAGSLLAVLYVPFIASSYRLGSEWLGAVGIMLLFFVLSTRKPMSKIAYVGIGMLFGFMLLLKPYYIYLPIGYSLYLLSLLGRRKWMASLGLIVTGMSVVCLAWIVRTYDVTGRWYFLQGGTHYVIRTGSCPENLCSSDEVVSGDAKPVSALSALWWYSIKKPRDMWGEAYGKHIFTDSPLVLSRPAYDVISIVHPFVLLAFVQAGLFVLKKNDRGSPALLALVWIFTAVVVHSALWSQPRFLIPLMPLILFVIAYDWSDFDWSFRLLPLWILVLMIGVFSWIAPTPFWGMLRLMWMWGYVLVWLMCLVFMFLQTEVLKKKGEDMFWVMGGTMLLWCVFVGVVSTSYINLFDEIFVEHTTFPVSMWLGRTILF